MEVRAYGVERGKPKKELVGAACLLKGSDFRASLFTPSNVRVPSYGHQSSELTIFCKKDGYKDKLQTVHPDNVTKLARLVAGSNAGLIGLAIMAAANAASDEKKHVFQYPNASVDMRKVKEKK